MWVKTLNSDVVSNFRCLLSAVSNRPVKARPHALLAIDYLNTNHLIIIKIDAILN